MSVRIRLFAVLSIPFFYGCAAVNAPEGGPRDEKKPLLVSTTPADKTTNFNGKIITLTFDEDIRTKDLNKELIITPNSGATYSTRTDRENLILEFSKPLEENTTYFLNFGQGVEDLTEGNKAQQVTLSFSTGNFLDTATVSGTVQDYLTGAPETNLTVALYPESDTSNIRSNKPYYFTRSNADGSFRMQNIKAGNYRIFAHQDKNNSETYDNEAEKIAYLPQPISIAPVIDSVLLKTVRLDTKKPFVITVEKFLDMNALVYNEGIRKVTFRTIDKIPAESKLLALPDQTGKKINVYAENRNLPDMLLAISTDSSGNTGQDTVKFSLANKPAIPAQLTYKIDKQELLADQQNQIKLTFPVPIKITGKSPFSMLEDTNSVVTPSYPKDYQLNDLKTELIISYFPKAKKTVELIIDTTQLTAINGKPFRKQKQVYSLTRKATTGSVTGTVKTNYKNYTVELLDEKSMILKSEANLKKLFYPDLLPGNYTIRVKVDENNDGKWSLGDKKLKTLPEKLYVYPKPVAVRANWEIEDIDLVF